MDLKAYIDLIVKVVADWRVLACTVGVLVIWSLFRFVGVISHRSPRRYARPKSPGPASPQRRDEPTDEG